MDKALVASRPGSTTGQFEITRLSGLEFDRHWDALRKELGLVPHLWQDRWTLESIYYSVCSGEMQVWALGHSPKIELVVITQLALYPAIKTLQIMFAIGEGVLEESIDLLDATLEKYAAMYECSKIEVVGRDGWVKLLGPRGFTRRFVVLERDVKNITVN